MFVDWNRRELHIKLVYYGPPLSGKTTNLEQIHHQTPEKNCSKLISVKTREDRTLFFDFMQLNLGEVKGLQPKFKLYTVPGQSYYAATRKLVLQNVDGLIFVADSSPQRLAANRQAINNMWQQLESIGRSSNDIPMILQCNKQDLSNAVPAKLLSRFLAVPEGTAVIPAVAIKGQGTVETLKQLIGRVLTRI